MTRRPPSCPLALVLLASTAMGQDELRELVNHALEQARPALLEHLHAASRGGVRAGELALLSLAAIHDGVDAADANMEKAMQQLAKAKTSETYDLALRLLVLDASPDFPNRLVQARRDAKALLANRDSQGGFGYQGNPLGWDLSNTQYAALGLRAAKAIGVKIENSIWTRMAQEIGESQEADGSFGYRNRARRDRPEMGGSASMTAAGIAVLAICRQEAGLANGGEVGVDKRLARAWQWFDKNARWVGAPDQLWAYYFHYGLERAAILCDVTEVGGVDWYAKGAKMFVDAQLPGGGWRGPTEGYPGTQLERGAGDGVPTAFAILFLRRKFQKVSGPITPHVVTLAAVGPKSKPADVEACTDELVRRGMEAMPELLQALRSEIEPQRRAATAALAKIAGETFAYDPALDVEGNRDALRKAELWYLRHR